MDALLHTPNAETIPTKSHSAVRPRLFFLDFIRTLATLLVVLAHFQDPYLMDKHYFPIRPFGIYLGSLGVSLFFIVSGAALMYVYGEQSNFRVLRFYKKRARALFPMFWLAFITTHLLLFLRNGTSPLVTSPSFKIASLSVIGLDGYARVWGIETLYVVGEWFLGFIILFYLIFPILRYGINQHPAMTCTIIALLYVATRILLYFFPLPHKPIDTILTLRLPELAFGMICTSRIKSIPTYTVFSCLCILAAQQLFHILDELTAISVVGILCFCIGAWIGERIDTWTQQTSVSAQNQRKSHKGDTKKRSHHKIIQQFIRRVILYVSAISYPIFLVHHQIISQVYTLINPTSLTRNGAYILLLAVVLLVSVVALILKKCTNSVQKLARAYTHASSL